MNISPTGWARKRGMIFSSHHDAPVAFPDSMRVLDATVTRRARGSGRIVGPDQRVDVITALKAMTIWPAYHHFEEKTKGSLEPGKLADFAILSRDPTGVEPTTIADIKVTETVKEGKTIFRLEPAAQADTVAPDITPLLTAFSGHRGALDDGCAHDAMFRMTELMVAGQAGR
jgi:predicted amidohydrolase YtcJ